MKPLHGHRKQQRMMHFFQNRQPCCARPIKENNNVKHENMLCCRVEKANNVRPFQTNVKLSSSFAERLVTKKQRVCSKTIYLLGNTPALHRASSK